MKIPKAVGGSYAGVAVGGRQFGQNVPMKTVSIATAQPSRSGFKAQGSLVGHVAGIRGLGTPATITMKRASLQRPDAYPANKAQFGRFIMDFSGKKRI